jgi:hypothetical protein
MVLLVINTVDFDIIDKLRIRYSAFVRYWKKKCEYNDTVQQLQIDLEKASDSGENYWKAV